MVHSASRRPSAYGGHNPDEAADAFPPHDGQGPDVDPVTGDERETTGLDEHGDPL